MVDMSRILRISNLSIIGAKIGKSSEMNKFSAKKVALGGLYTSKTSISLVKKLFSNTSFA